MVLVMNSCPRILGVLPESRTSNLFPEVYVKETTHEVDEKLDICIDNLCHICHIDLISF